MRINKTCLLFRQDTAVWLAAQSNGSYNPMISDNVFSVAGFSNYFTWSSYNVPSSANYINSSSLSYFYDSNVMAQSGLKCFSASSSDYGVQIQSVDCNQQLPYICVSGISYIHFIDVLSNYSCNTTMHKLRTI